MHVSILPRFLKIRAVTDQMQTIVEFLIAQFNAGFEHEKEPVIPDHTSQEYNIEMVCVGLTQPLHFTCIDPVHVGLMGIRKIGDRCGASA